ncbi:MAG: DNA polymerase IV [Candidatus Nanopelagicaceae bacterium]
MPEVKPSTILHVDMDAFFASVEEADNPELKGKAVVVGAGPRAVVTSANYVARGFGIRAAMPVAQARRLAPHAIFLPNRHHRYGEVSADVMRIFGDFSPHVEPLSLDEAFIDVSGATRLIGTARDIAVQIRARIEGELKITCSVGISTTKLIAKLASGRCKPNGILEIADDRVLEFLHPLPVRELWGVGPKTGEALTKLGLQTIGDIAHTPRGTLIRALGQGQGESLYELAWGRDLRAVEESAIEKSIGAEETFARDIDDNEELLAELLRVTERVARRLRDQQFVARTIAIKIRFSDFTTITRSKSIDLPTASTQEIYEQVRRLFTALGLVRARVRLVGVRLENLESDAGLVEQLTLGSREKGWRQVDQALDRARRRFGGGALKPARLIESSGQDEEE